MLADSQGARRRLEGPEECSYCPLGFLQWLGNNFLAGLKSCLQIDIKKQIRTLKARTFRFTFKDFFFCCFLFHYGLLQDIHNSSLSCTIGPCCLELLNNEVLWENVGYSVVHKTDILPALV